MRGCGQMKNMKKSNIIENKVQRGSIQERDLLMKDGLYLRERKRVYLYWYKFLQEAEKSSDYEVKWSNYSGWGNANEVLGSKFDTWWIDNWKKLFGVKSKNGIPKFNIANMPRNFEPIRLAYLVHLIRDTPIDYPEKHKIRFHGFHLGNRKTKKRVNPNKPVVRSTERTNYLSIAYRLYQTESSKKRWTPVAHLDPDDKMSDHKNIKKEIKSLLKKGDDIMMNVSNGIFP